MIDRPKKSYRVRFRWRGKQHCVSLVGLNKDQAEQVDRHIAKLIGAKTSATEPATITQQWVAQIDDQLHEKLLAETAESSLCGLNSEKCLRLSGSSQTVRRLSRDTPKAARTFGQRSRRSSRGLA